jgi:flagellar hook-associated protein 1 FlgK
MGSGVFNVAVSGLNAAQLGIQTTSHNIANASTTGYNRQRIEQATNTPLFTGAGFIGQGTNVETVSRVYSQFLTEQVLAAQSNVEEANAYLAQIEQIDNLLADPNAGLSPAMAEFFKAVQDLAANPSSIPARQATLSAAQALSARFQSLDNRIQEVRDGVNQQMLGEVEVINSLVAAIGDANQQVILSRAAGPGQTPNDLLDKRDQLIAQLNTHIRAEAVAQDDGTVNIFIGTGQPMVVGTQVSTLTGKQALDDPEKTSIAINSPFGGSFYLLESQLTGGALGGLVRFRAETLDAAQNNLGRIALGLAQTFNSIHKSGQDLSGVLGADFFAVSAPVVNSSLLNASNGTLISAQIITSDYRVVFNGGNYDITRLSDGASFPGQNLPWFADGVEITQTAAPNAGDVFVVKPGNPPGQRVLAESTNTGTGGLDSTGSNLAALDGSDYRLDYIGVNQWRLTRLGDNTIWTAAGGSDQQALDNLLQNQPGFSMTLAGVPPTVGDSFMIQPTRTVARNIAVAINDPRALAAAAPFRTSGALTNTGLGAISSGSVSYVGNGNLPMAPSPGGDITLTFNGAIPGFTVIPGAATIAYNPATQTKIDITVNGLSFSISGAPATGDRFTLARNDNGVSDNRNAQLLGAIQTANILNGASSSTSTGANATLQSAYSQIVSRIGSKAREIEVTGQAQESLADQATQSQAQLSGVNLDEEAANLLKYQQAYQAAAKLLAIVGTLFDELLALGG